MSVEGIFLGQTNWKRRMQDRQNNNNNNNNNNLVQEVSPIQLFSGK